ncbi:phosphopentomutase [Weissella uvarum]|uniref:phosphopentomutase n=1 Tax=Weissella uvarum TaxID=1479233 RepID=UPI0019606713|nr:phosphopentomutase [Weissella uvarum]MBM7617411.1 phosphopentomutase [Weissella uvarum]MCM0595704.1 phosphopentomutase [Weissella uvarum]
MTYQRIFGIVLDSVGIGAAADAAKYDDDGSDTLGHIGAAYEGQWQLPNLQKLGLGNIRTNNPIQGVEPIADPIGVYGKMQETSVGKDSMDGHWEMMGLPVKTELATYPNGFPKDLLHKIADYSGHPILVNKPYSGTEVIHDYGEQALQEKALIIYTSGDSVLQIAAHEDAIPVQELYKICEYARTLVNDAPNLIGRVIARPFVGDQPNNFKRTANRHDFALKPMGETDLNRLQNAGISVIGIGKINDIFSGEGINEGIHTESNMDGMDQIDAWLQKDFNGFCFANLVDFDAMYGHRRDPKGMGQALMDFDQRLGDVLDQMRPDDLLMITADHGNDPGFKGTDHTREFVPMLAYSPSLTNSHSIGIRPTYADFGQTILENFNVNPGPVGKSFLNDLKNQ